MHNTRQLYSLHPPKCRTELSKRFVKYKGVIIWNVIVKCIEANVNISTFNKSVNMSILKKNITCDWTFNA